MILFFFPFPLLCHKSSSHVNVGDLSFILVSVLFAFVISSPDNPIDIRQATSDGWRDFYCSFPWVNIHEPTVKGPTHGVIEDYTIEKWYEHIMELWMGHNEYYNVGFFAVTYGDVVLRTTNSNFNKKAPCTLFFPSNIVSITIACTVEFY